MIKQIENLPKNVVGFTYTGKVSGKDYETVIFPAIDKAAKGKKKMRMIIHFDKTFDKISLKAMMDDAFVGLKYYKDFEKIALVSNHKGINRALNAMSFLIPGEIKIFSLSELNSAIEWISNNK